MAQIHSFYPLEVESDCLEIVRATYSASPDFSDLGFLIDDLMQALGHTSAAILRHVKRTANFVAHHLDREAANNGYLDMFLCIPPSCVKNVVLTDCNDS